MHLSLTLSKYLSKQLLQGLLIVLTAFVCLIYLFDLVEHIRRASGRDGVGFATLMTMSALRLPSLIQQVLPFGFMFATMFCFIRLSRSQELIVARAAGVSVWQILAPGLMVTLALGIATITIFNPISSTLVGQYEQMEAKYLRGRPSLLAVSSGGLWLRQGDQAGQSVIHAQAVDAASMRLDDVIIFLYEGTDRFAGRIDAKSAELKAGHWLLNDAWSSGPEQDAKHFDQFVLNTSLTREQILDSFAPPETLSFWDLPAFIDAIEDAGFSGSRHRLYFHKLLSLPFLLCAMVLIASVFTLRLSNRSGIGYMVLGGVMAGFLLYFLSDVTIAFGLSGAIPPPLAAWTPTIITMAIGTASLLYLEDG